MSQIQSIVLGGGCFWCVEAVFQRVRGVESVVSGYAGGNTVDPTYDQVCSGRTHHAEVIQINFDSGVITLAEILDIFFHLHDPTTLNRQGGDAGTQYRSVIFYKDDSQREISEQIKTQVAADWADPIVTEITPLDIFYQAEDYHQDYFNQHPDQGYCSVVINPKIAKLRQKYFEKVIPG